MLPYNIIIRFIDGRESNSSNLFGHGTSVTKVRYEKKSRTSVRGRQHIVPRNLYSSIAEFTFIYCPLTGLNCAAEEYSSCRRAAPEC